MTVVRILVFGALLGLSAGCEDGRLNLPFVDGPELDKHMLALRDAYKRKTEWCDGNGGAEAEEGMAAEFCDMAMLDIQVHSDAAYKLNFPQTYILASVEVAAAQGAVDYLCAVPDARPQCSAAQTDLANAETRLGKTRSYGN